MWIQLSFLVLGIMAFQDIIHRYLMKIGYGPIELVLYGLIPTVVFGLLYIIYTDTKLVKLNAKTSLIFVFSGILSFFTFLWMRKAQINSPNIGYVNVIIYSSVLVTILLTAILFKDKLHPRALLGALFTIIGLGLITSVK
jgi:drug/metabolite transporter (DMT)-like permease